MDDYSIEQEIRHKGFQAVVNNNDLFVEFINEQPDWLDRCPRILSDLMEEYNNDWIEYCENLNAPIEWDDLSQAEQEALIEEDFPIERMFIPEYFKDLEAKGLVRIIRIDHRRAQIDILQAGRDIIPKDEETS